MSTELMLMEGQESGLVLARDPEYILEEAHRAAAALLLRVGPVLSLEREEGVEPGEHAGLARTRGRRPGRLFRSRRRGEGARRGGAAGGVERTRGGRGKACVDAHDRPKPFRTRRCTAGTDL